MPNSLTIRVALERVDVAADQGADPRLEGSRLNAIAVLSTSDAWAVGQTQESNGGILTLTEQFDGSTWKISASPDPGSLGKLVENTLQGVGSAGGENLFAVGTQEIPGQLVQRTLAIASTKG